jgi:uncharacterized protein (DUF1697 family)
VTTFVTLLRAVNLGRHQQIAMSALRDFAKDLGFLDVWTILQSGNLVFDAERQGAQRLENLLESKAKTALRLGTDFFVRSAKEWKVLIERNPFPGEAARTPGRLIVMFLKDPPSSSGLKALRDAIRGPEVVEVVEKQAYIVYPDGVGRSRLTNAVIEAKLDTRATGRNWNTVLKIATLAGCQPAS